IPLDGIPFHPYYTVHDILGVSVFLIAFSAILFFAPELGGYFLEYNNFIPANPLVTPSHIAPVWYFTPFYSILRATTEDFLLFWMIPFLIFYAILVLVGARNGAFKLIGPAVSLALIVGFLVIDAKFWGVVAMGASVMIFFGLPWFDNSPAKSLRYRPGWHKWLYGLFVIVFLVLGYFGVLAPSAIGSLFSKIGTLLYFAFFLLMPWWSRMGEFKPVPDRVTFAAH
ncbi:MAG TPA: cytochrome bc complex cytochrome b subunit, partial [Quisquiliibacterium sp.]|nr:cytochrome bc complex cytochrome b subunit [Quisquiliibacterium sp.]